MTKPSCLYTQEPCPSPEACDKIGCCAIVKDRTPTCGPCPCSDCKPLPLIPDDNAGRKAIPVCTGVLDYFPSALLEVAKVSQAGNDQHNPGQPLHWARGKSMNQSDTMLRHYMQRGTIDTDNVRHLAKAAWRVLAELQLEMEAAGYPIARGAKEAS